MIQMLNRSRIKLELIIADKRYFFSSELTVPTHRVLLEKWQVLFRISSLIVRDISHDTVSSNIPFNLIYDKLHCRPKKYYAKFFASFLLLAVSVLIRSIISSFYLLSAFSLFFFTFLIFSVLCCLRAAECLHTI